MSEWFSVHTHSSYSHLDGMTPVPQLVEKAHKLGYPALGMMDHGNMASTVQLYKGCMKLGMLPFPAVEAYLLDPLFTGDLKDKEAAKAGRYHVGLVALSEKGYKALVKLVSLSHTRPRFNRFPRITLTDLAELSDQAKNHVAVLTGCYFGLTQQMLVTQGEDKAQKVIEMYAKWFPNTFVEVQHHNISDHDGLCETDDEIVESLFSLAEVTGLPVMATQDSHYCDQSHRLAHNLMKRMVYSGTDDEFPGDTFHLASSEWVAEHYDDKQWVRIEEGAQQFLGLNNVQIKPLDKFKVHVPSIVEDPQRVITARATKALIDYLGDISHRSFRKYHNRLEYELRIIGDLNIASYFVVVQQAVDWCKRKGICIEARGSANGSLVCYLLGITQVDPIKWNLMFERFLSRDRIKPPDIDMDIEDVHRDRLVQYLNKHFDSVRIGTWSRLGTNEEGKGSILVTYKSWLGRRAEEIDGKEAKQRVYAFLQTVDDVKRNYSNFAKYGMEKTDHEVLVKMNEMSSSDSGSKHGIFKSYGSHAGGILLSGDKLKIRDYIPTMLIASSDTPVTQFDQDDVEEFGLLKMDWLGQTTLTVMRICQQLMGKKDPTDFSWIKDDDSQACKLLREGRTDTGIFHFEGFTKSKGGKELGIKSTKDVVLAQALYMPGAMDTGQTAHYVRARKDPEFRGEVEYIHPIFKDVLKETYGAVIFQEQVINIMRRLGMSMEGVNKFFKVVKDSGKGSGDRNRERMNAVREEFDGLCKKNGIEDTEAAWAQTAGFVSYGFNSAHATGYGIRAYRCAYLKAHYPLEFMTALLQCWAGTDKEQPYVREARRMSIRILPPDVNISSSTWTLDKKSKAIRRGLLSIKGIGMAAAEELSGNAPYKKVEDIIERCDSKAVTGGKDWAKEKKLKGVLLRLEEVGALDSIKH